MGAEGGFQVYETSLDWSGIALVLGVLAAFVAGPLASHLRTHRAATAVVLVGLLAFGGLSVWAVAGPDRRRCVWAVTVQTRDMGYLEVPCGSGRRPSEVP